MFSDDEIASIVREISSSSSDGSPMTAETQREFEKKLGKKVKHTWNLIGHNCLFAHADFVTNIMNQAWNPSSTENKIGRKALAEFLLTKKRMDFFFLWKSTLQKHT